MRASALVSERLATERFERGLVHAWVDVGHQDEAGEWLGRGGRGLHLRLGLGFDLGVGVRAGGGFAALVVGHDMIRAMHFSLCARHLIQHVPMRLGGRAQPVLVSFLHDGGTRFRARRLRGRVRSAAMTTHGARPRGVIWSTT